MDLNNISFITFTNYGYLDYTKNLILSLEKINFPLSLKIYCIDQKSFDDLKKFNKNIILELLNDETNQNQDIVGWKEKGWNTMVYSKFKCIYKELLKNEFVLFTDSDIVFEKNPLEYLLTNIDDYDMLIQQNMNYSTYLLNSGFIFIKANEKMIDFFNWENINLNSFTCDQDYINDHKDKINYKLLNQELFPIQEYYYIEKPNINPYIIHYNRNIGNNKKIDFINSKKWYLK